MIQYTVNHAFGHDGVYYATENAADIGKLPPEVIADVVDRGIVTKTEVPDAPANTPGLTPGTAPALAPILTTNPAASVALPLGPTITGG